MTSASRMACSLFAFTQADEDRKTRHRRSRRAQRPRDEYANADHGNFWGQAARLRRCCVVPPSWQSALPSRSER